MSSPALKNAEGFTPDGGTLKWCLQLVWKNANLTAPILDFVCYNGIDPLVLHLSTSTPGNGRVQTSLNSKCHLFQFHCPADWSLSIRLACASLQRICHWIPPSWFARTKFKNIRLFITASRRSKSLTSQTFAHWREVAIELWTTDMK